MVFAHFQLARWQRDALLRMKYGRKPPRFFPNFKKIFEYIKKRYQIDTADIIIINNDSQLPHQFNRWHSKEYMGWHYGHHRENTAIAVCPLGILIHNCEACDIGGHHINNQFFFLRI